MTTEIIDISKCVEDATCCTEVINRIKELQIQGFGGIGFNEFAIVPYIRHGKVFVLKLEEKIKAYAMFMRDWNKHKRAYFISTVVDNELGGKGIGTLFLKECISRIRSLSIEFVELTVSPKNEKAIFIYEEKLGFKKIRYEQDEYGPGEDRIIMELNLLG